ncbi:MAG: 30S ribosomal protein S13 [bacterium]
MVRVAGVELPDNKAAVVSLTYLYGIGRSLARKILKKAGVDETKKMKDLKESELARIRGIIDREYKVEGELRQILHDSIQRLKEIKCYRGLRMMAGLPVRGQRTRKNARTWKGPRPSVIKRKKTIPTAR